MDKPLTKTQLICWAVALSTIALLICAGGIWGSLNAYRERHNEQMKPTPVRHFGHSHTPKTLLTLWYVSR